MNRQVATFGGGCFWGVEALIKKIDGVLSTRVGYAGGHTANPDYKSVCTGETGHAEVVQVEFDADTISFKQLLGYFWRLHDPTQLNRQGVDQGTQYRSVIFYHSEEQRQQAVDSKKDFDLSGVFNQPAVTEISAFTEFYDGEEYHQDYFDKNPGMVCHIMRDR